jgi:cell division transport system permease protein
MRLQFILSETFSGLRRNLSIVISIVLVAVVTLFLVGLGLVSQKQVSLSKNYWYDKVEVSIFLCGNNNTDTASCSGGAVTQAQKDQILAQLNALKPLVERVYYESQQQAFTRFMQQFKGTAFSKNVTADQLPESYRVKLSDPQKYAVIASSLQGAPGVELVQDQRQLLNPLFVGISWLTRGALGIAGVMVIAFLLLNTTMIRLSAFSRRRETGIMRLVGASNFTIQVPFILETVLATLLGGVLSVIALWCVVKFFIQDKLAHAVSFTTFVEPSVALTIAPYLILGGVVLAGAVSTVTLRFYLRV